MTPPRSWAWVGAMCLLLTATLSADTIWLRDGRRLQGQLVSIRNGIVEVEVQRGFFGRERTRFNQSEILRIEFDEASRPDSGYNNNSGGSGGSTAPTRPGGLRERSVVVNGSEGWRDTGLIVRSGQSVYFEATGRVRWGPGRQDGPDGERGSPRNENRPMPNRPAAALIGRIGESNDYFFIGVDTEAIRVRDSGRLYLGINDDFLQDNTGSFRVTVYY